MSPWLTACTCFAARITWAGWFWLWAGAGEWGKAALPCKLRRREAAGAQQCPLVPAGCLSARPCSLGRPWCNPGQHGRSTLSRPDSSTIAFIAFNKRLCTSQHVSDHVGRWEMCTCPRACGWCPAGLWCLGASLCLPAAIPLTADH